MTTATIEIPEVYKGIAKILATLGVAKGGVLPSNMGGKPYITAVDVAREVKTLFVENDLIFLPFERETQKELIVHKDRINVAVSIEGQYTIISTKDGSQAVVQGVGDGLAGGTAVASNIASTNALKNALLRTFLITEQSVEDAAKNGVSDEAPAATTTAAQRKVEAAKQATAPKPGPDSKDLNTLKAQIRDAISAGTVSRDAVNAKMQELQETTPLSGVLLHKQLIEELAIK